MTAEQLRADARRNRAQIIAAARTVFAERGLDVPMDDIARAARVGVGTLYRRFPDRDALVRAVAADSLTAILAELRAAAAAEPTAWLALVRFLTAAADLQLSVQLTVVPPIAIAVLAGDPVVTGLRGELLDRLDGLVRAAQREGRLRPDVGTGDVAQLFAMLLRPLPARDPQTARLSAARCAAILIDGLLALPGSPLPGSPLPGSPLHRDDLGR